GSEGGGRGWSEQRREPWGRGPPAEAQPQQREAHIVPIDHEPHAPSSQREPGDDERRECRRILDEHQIRVRKPSQRSPQSGTEASSIDEGNRRVSGAPSSATQSRRNKP